MPKVKLNIKIKNREQQKFGNLQHVVFFNPVVLSLGHYEWNQDYTGYEIEPQEVKGSGCQEVFFCHIFTNLFFYLINRIKLEN